MIISSSISSTISTITSTSSSTITISNAIPPPGWMVVNEDIGAKRHQCLPQGLVHYSDTAETSLSALAMSQFPTPLAHSTQQISSSSKGGKGGREGVGAHQGQTNREGEKDIWWTARTARGGTGHLGRTETQRGRLWTACGQRCVDSKNSQTTPATTSTSSIRQLLGAADTQTAHHATFSTVPTRQLLGSANAETTPAGAPAAAADRK